MKRVSIIELDKDFEVPESWDEMTDQQVRFVFRQLYEKIPADIFLSRLLDCFLFGKTKIQSGEAHRWSPFSKELAEVLFSFMFRATAKGYELQYPEVRNRVPVLYCGLRKFYGIKSNLSNLTFEEFEAANMWLKENAAGDADSIYPFVACLYKPKGEKYSEEQVEKTAGIIKKHFSNKNWLLHLIVTWYYNCINEIQTQDICFNGNIINFSCLFPQKQEKDDTPEQKNNLGWLPILHDFAEKGVFGNLKETKQATLYDLLALMLDQHNENKQMKEEYKKLLKARRT